MIVAPSLLSADFNNLGRDIEMINESEAGMFHMDVMDGVFVPNISFGFPVIKAVSRLARKPLDVHLMIVKPQRYISQVRDCGAAIMNIHQEACIHLHRTVAAIHDAGMKAAVTLNPSTPVETLRDIVGDLDMVLLMTVNPGFAGQKLVPQTLAKITRLRKMLDESGYAHVRIEVDGNVSFENAVKMRAAGADLFVAGTSAVFREGGIEANMAKLLDCIR